MKYALAIAAALTFTTSALAGDIGTRVGLARGGMTVGSAQGGYDRARDDRTTVIQQNEPGDHATVITKELEDGVESRTVIHDDRN